MVQAMLSDEPALFDGLEVSYIDLGEKWCGGHTASILAAAASFDTEECAMIVGADHIIDENLLVPRSRRDHAERSALMPVKCHMLVSRDSARWPRHLSATTTRQSSSRPISTTWSASLTT